jgi:hypothetical protein
MQRCFFRRAGVVSTNKTNHKELKEKKRKEC